LRHFALFLVQRDSISLGIAEPDRLRIHTRQHKGSRRLNCHEAACRGIGTIPEDHFSGLYPVTPVAFAAMSVGQLHGAKASCAGIDQYVRSPLGALGSWAVDD
jgi:hypothetical protein